MRNRCSALICAALISSSTPALAQQLFATPEDAVSALVGAAKAGDQSKIATILGPGGEEVAKSGDPVADQNAREKFIAEYDAKHAVEPEGNGTQTLIIGEDNWPFPIPLVNKNGQWQFDTSAQAWMNFSDAAFGKNELSTIQVSLAYVQAQNEYASLNPMGLGHAYAQRIVSRKGKKDGLYWPTTAGEEPSPLGDLAAKAAAEGYKAGEKPYPLSRLLLPHFERARAETPPAGPMTMSLKAE